MRVILVLLVVMIYLVVMIMPVTAILAIGVVMVASEMVAVHIDAAVKVTVRLVHKRTAYCLAGITEHDGKSAFSLHDLGHTFGISAAETNKAPCKRDAAEDPQDSADSVHRRFLPNAKDASESRMAT